MAQDILGCLYLHRFNGSYEEIYKQLLLAKFEKNDYNSLFLASFPFSTPNSPPVAIIFLSISLPSEAQEVLQANEKLFLLGTPKGRTVCPVGFL